MKRNEKKNRYMKTQEKDRKEIRKAHEETHKASRDTTVFGTNGLDLQRRECVTFGGQLVVQLAAALTKQTPEKICASMGLWVYGETKIASRSTNK